MSEPDFDRDLEAFISNGPPGPPGDPEPKKGFFYRVGEIGGSLFVFILAAGVLAISIAIFYRLFWWIWPS